ncbi:head-tail connector protein [Oceanibium sediminis]|uniref:head-tail connector protein n=1 Tax=Oceanibium sediminis TaxID=2026339 RepID=UPI000DD4493B|nr:hypothetical protein [Oceanibium sediminis]
MNLVETSTVGAERIPVRAFADHLMLGSGFEDDGSQDALLEGYLRAAISAVEARTGKVLLSRGFTWDVTRWFSPERQGLPVGPVSALEAITLVTRAGDEVLVNPARYGLRKDLFRPEITADSLPSVPVGGIARIAFTAGFGLDWRDVPPDLAQAVMLLAAGNYEARTAESGARSSMPFQVLALIEPYKTVRLLGDVL